MSIREQKIPQTSFRLNYSYPYPRHIAPLTVEDDIVQSHSKQVFSLSLIKY